MPSLGPIAGTKPGMHGYKNINLTCLDPHRIHLTAMTERLKFYARLVMWVDPHTFQRKLLAVPGKSGKYPATNTGLMAIHLFILDKSEEFTWWLYNQ